MAEIIDGVFSRNETNQKSMGGTERLTLELANRLDPDDLKDVQIVSSRVRELKDDMIRIFWAHDLPGDPESEFIGTKFGQDKFHKFVFVSNWQMQGYINRYNLPPSKCVVLRNFIDPIETHEKPDPSKGLNLIYHTTPHRGLNILVPVFQKLREKYDNIHLDVYSSFALYGWEERDKQFEELFKVIQEDENMTNHGTVSNEDIRQALTQSHIFAYPSIWQETSCLSLMEAMSSRNVCVHSNYGGIFETSSHWTNMYQYNQDLNEHASACYNMLEVAIENYNMLYQNTNPAKVYTDTFYSWQNRKAEWTALIRALKMTVTDRKLPEDQGPVFSYKTA